jgi:hypothetical protein
MAPSVNRPGPMKIVVSSGTSSKRLVSLACGRQGRPAAQVRTATPLIAFEATAFQTTC